MSRPASVSSARKNSLSQIAELMALAILRKRAKKERASSSFQLDFAENGSMCGGEKNLNGEYTL